MARPDASLYGEIGLNTSKFQSGVKQASGSLRGLAQTMGSLQGLIGGALGAGSVALIGKMTLEFGKLGAESLRLKSSFEEMAKSHQSNSESILDSLKRASQGAISETDLILSANRAMMLGLGANADQLGELLEVAAFRARAMGLSTTQAFNDIVTGIGRKSPLILDNLGIVGLKMDETTSKAEIMAQVITQGQKMIADAGGMVADEASRYEAMAAKWADLKTRFAEMAVPAASTILNVVVNGMEDLEKAADLLTTIGEVPEPTVKELLMNVTYQSSTGQTYGTMGDLVKDEVKEAIDAAQQQAAQSPGGLFSYGDIGAIVEQQKQFERVQRIFDIVDRRTQRSNDELLEMAQRINQLETELQKVGPAANILTSELYRPVEASSQLLGVLAKATQLVADGVVDARNWGDAWRDTPVVLEDFATNFAILKARFAEGLIPEDQFVRDWNYVESQWTSAVDQMREGMRKLQMDTLKAMGLMGQAARDTEVDYLHLAGLLKDVSVAGGVRPYGPEGSAPGGRTPEQQMVIEMMKLKVANRPNPWQMGYGDYSTAAQFSDQAVLDAYLAANKDAADDFSQKIQGANTIIADDITRKVNKALGIDDPTRGGPLDQGDAPGEWWRQTAAIANEGEDAGGGTYGKEMRADIAKIADYMIGPGAGEKVLGDNAAYRAAAESIYQTGQQFGFAETAGAIQLNTGVVTIDWGAAGANMAQQDQFAQDIQAGGQFAAQQMGVGGDQLTSAVGGLQGAMGTFAGAVGGGMGVPGAGGVGATGGVEGSPMTTMNTDATTLAATLTNILLPSVTTVSDFFTMQLNVQLTTANLLIGTDIPVSIETAIDSFEKFVEEGLDPAIEAAASLDGYLGAILEKLAALGQYGFAFGGVVGSDSGYQSGGVIGKSVGDPVWVLAHENEMVLNTDQQREVARMMGLGGAFMAPMGGGDMVEIHLHIGAMLGREADAYRLANELLPHLNRARRTQKWD